MFQGPRHIAAAFCCSLLLLAGGCDDPSHSVDPDGGAADLAGQQADRTLAVDAPAGGESGAGDQGPSDQGVPADASGEPADLALAEDGRHQDQAIDQAPPDSAPHPVVPPELIDTPLQRPGSCGGGWSYYSACVPGTPGRSNGCCHNSASLGTPSSTISFNIAALADGSLELRVTGYTVDSSTHSVTLSGGETQPGRFVIDPASFPWPYGLPPKGKLQADIVGGEVTLSFSGTAQKSTTAYCPDESVSVQCSWEP